jgi:hypothetical protein
VFTDERQQQQNNHNTTTSRAPGNIRERPWLAWERPRTENSVRDLKSPLEPYIAYVCEGSGHEIKIQPGTRHEVD